VGIKARPLHLVGYGDGEEEQEQPAPGQEERSSAPASPDGAPTET
jgi:hypothetical protein